jgi:hypothetical protein
MSCQQKIAQKQGDPRQKTVHGRKMQNIIVVSRRNELDSRVNVFPERQILPEKPKRRQYQDGNRMPPDERQHAHGNCDRKGTQTIEHRRTRIFNCESRKLAQIQNFLVGSTRWKTNRNGSPENPFTVRRLAQTSDRPGRRHIRSGVGRGDCWRVAPGYEQSSRRF